MAPKFNFSDTKSVYVTGKLTEENKESNGTWVFSAPIPNYTDFDSNLFQWSLKTISKKTLHKIILKNGTLTILASTVYKNPPISVFKISCNLSHSQALNQNGDIIVAPVPFHTFHLERAIKNVPKSRSKIMHMVSCSYIKRFAWIKVLIIISS